MSDIECECNLRTRLVGDGCEKCNPALALEYAKQTIADLEGELAEAQKDAARYRWLRERVGVDVREKYAYFPLRRSQLDNSSTDAAIDAAMQEGER
jgi:hypothetical protein